MRFKTESEFIEEFGVNWREKVQWNPSGNMDHLLGKPYIKEEFEGGGPNFQWEIYESMLTQKEITFGNFGWICPVCGRGNSPFNNTCPCRGFIVPKITCKLG